MCTAAARPIALRHGNRYRWACTWAAAAATGTTRQMQRDQHVFAIARIAQCQSISARCKPTKLSGVAQW